MKKILFIVIIVILLGAPSLASEIMTLITEREAAIKEPPPGHFEVGGIMNVGPEIKVLSPGKNEECEAPVKIIILFLAKEGKEVDLSSLKVEYLKGFAINITKRVLPYTDKEGIKIEHARIPSGKHKLRVTIGDKEGGITQEIFTVKVL